MSIDTEKNNVWLIEFGNYLREEEKSKATIEKYLRDINKFNEFVEERCGTVDKISKLIVIQYKEGLMQRYEASSVNSMLTAVNQYLLYVGKYTCKVKHVKIQRQPFVEEEKHLTVDDVRKLLEVASLQGKQRLEMIIETLCHTGIRVSELPFITIERLHAGIIKIFNKGKVRVIAVTKDLKKKLLGYARQYSIKSGPLFITRNGQCVDRSNLWKEIKNICRAAGVAAEKGFPHNFRHLFARCFYEVDRDLVNLADILGHSNIETTRIYTTTTYVNFMKKLENMGQYMKIRTT